MFNRFFPLNPLIIHYLSDFLPGTAKVDEGYIDEVSAIANGDGLLFERALRSDQHHVTDLWILEQNKNIEGKIKQLVWY